MNSTTYTDAQLHNAANGLRRIAGGALGDYEGSKQDERFLHGVADLISEIRPLLTERQAGSLGDVHCPVCGTHEISLTRTCHNSACSEYAAETTVHEGWKNPPQPPTKESVRGVSDADVERALLAFDEACRNDKKRIVSWVGHTFKDRIAIMRAALESFAKRGDGDE